MSLRDLSSSSCKNYVPVLPSFFFLQTKSRIQKIPKPKGLAMEHNFCHCCLQPLLPGAFPAVQTKGFGLGRYGFVGVADRGLLLLCCFWVGCCLPIRLIQLSLLITPTVVWLRNPYPRIPLSQSIFFFFLFSFFFSNFIFLSCYQHMLVSNSKRFSNG